MFRTTSIPTSRLTTLILILIMPLVMSGCASTQRASGPYRTPTEAARHPLRAQELTLRAADLIDHDPPQAERLLLEALTADLYHGPAHNNLGVLYLQQGKLYEAAHEFEWARKLMPGHPDPRINLALTLEQGGRIDEALAAYNAALDVYPEHIAAVQGLARLQVRHDRRDDRTAVLLREIALHGQSQCWRAWAQQQLVRIDR